MEVETARRAWSTRCHGGGIGPTTAGGFERHLRDSKTCHCRTESQSRTNGSLGSSAPAALADKCQPFKASTGTACKLGQLLNFGKVSGYMIPAGRGAFMSGERTFHGAHHQRVRS
jgi:hypothetical protein